jgi:hypothetical protein
MAWATSGTPEEQAACRPDVRRFCSKVKADAGDTAFLVCLENNRDNLTPKCLAVLSTTIVEPSIFGART